MIDPLVLINFSTAVFQPPPNNAKKGLLSLIGLLYGWWPLSTAQKCANVVVYFIVFDNGKPFKKFQAAC